jgi:hypothetical protein
MAKSTSSPDDIASGSFLQLFCQEIFLSRALSSFSPEAEAMVDVQSRSSEWRYLAASRTIASESEVQLHAQSPLSIVEHSRQL